MEERGGNRGSNSSRSRCLVVPKRDRGWPMVRNVYMLKGGRDRKRAQNVSCQPQNAPSRNCVARWAATHKKLPVCPHIHVDLSARPLCTYTCIRVSRCVQRIPYTQEYLRGGSYLLAMGNATSRDPQRPCTPFPP